MIQEILLTKILQVFLRHSSHANQLIHVYNSMVFSIFPDVCTQHHHQEGRAGAGKEVEGRGGGGQGEKAKKE